MHTPTTHNINSRKYEMHIKLVRIQTALLLLVICVGGVGEVSAAETASVLGGGITINEILIDPSDGETGFDTDQNGTIADTDEFFELYNQGSSTVDISGWELWDSGTPMWFTFPGQPDDGTTLLPAHAYAVIVVGVQTGGSLPDMTNPQSLCFDAGKGLGILNNGSDNVVLYDPGEDEYVQFIYNGDAEDDPTSTYAGFSSDAVRVGQVEDWGYDVDGKSLTRYPSGDTNIVVHDSIPGAGNASPTAIGLQSLNSNRSENRLHSVYIIALTGVIIATMILVRFHIVKATIRQ